MADARQSIDAFLGQGFYDEWQNMDRRLDREGRQFDLCSGACLVEYATLGALSGGASSLSRYGATPTEPAA